MTDQSTILSPVDGHGFSADDIALCGRVADTLNNHYPGHLWATHLNSDATGGVLIIRHMGLSTRYGYVLHLKSLHNDPDLKRVMRAGGEMLERARLAQKGRGEQAKHVDGMRPQDQPFNGIIV